MMLELMRRPDGMAGLEQPVPEAQDVRRPDLLVGSLVQIVSLNRPFLERQPEKSKTGSKNVKPGRAPGGDLTGADLIGAVGRVIQIAEASRNLPDPLVLVRVDDEQLYLNLSEVAPFETEPTRD